MSRSYKRRRREAYPEVGEQLDALWKGYAALAAGAPEPEGAASMRAEIAAVKAAHPKPARDGKA